MTELSSEACENMSNKKFSRIVLRNEGDDVKQKVQQIFSLRGTGLCQSEAAAWTLGRKEGSPLQYAAQPHTTTPHFKPIGGKLDHLISSQWGAHLTIRLEPIYCRPHRIPSKLFANLTDPISSQSVVNLTTRFQANRL